LVSLSPKNIYKNSAQNLSHETLSEFSKYPPCRSSYFVFGAGLERSPEQLPSVGKSLPFFRYSEKVGSGTSPAPKKKPVFGRSFENTYVFTNSLKKPNITKTNQDLKKVGVQTELAFFFCCNHFPTHLMWVARKNGFLCTLKKNIIRVCTVIAVP